MKALSSCNRISLVLAITAMCALQSSATTHFVSQTSPSPTPPYLTPNTAAHNIQDAVNVAVDGDTVLVAAGDYGVTNQITLTNAVRVQSSAGASQTFLTAYGGPCMLAISNTLAVADGFTFRPAIALASPVGAALVGGTIQNCNFTNFITADYGRAITMSGGTVSNVIVFYIRAPEGGLAAVYCSDSGLVTDSQILANTENIQEGGGIFLINSRLQNSVVSGAPGAGPHRNGPAVTAISSTVVDCIISNNFSIGQGGGAYLRDSLMDRCIVTGNEVGDGGSGFGGLGSGGGGIFETNSVIRSSLIVGNSMLNINPEPTSPGSLGGGVYMQGGALLNCTVSGNFQDARDGFPGDGGGVFAESGGITNCIIFFNSLNLPRPSTNWFNLGPAIFDHCCTAPDPGGTGNITSDPQFADLAGGNYRLAASSPCIGAGIVQPWMRGALDLDGNPRTTNGKVDMGAYETSAAPATPQEQVRALIAQVTGLVAAGTLPHGHGTALLASLQAALNSINRGKTAAACSQVEAFIQKVQAFTRQGRLNAADSQALISGAKDLRATLGCTGK